jgi:hypothetical protein
MSGHLAGGGVIENGDLPTYEPTNLRQSALHCCCTEEFPFERQSLSFDSHLPSLRSVLCALCLQHPPLALVRLLFSPATSHELDIVSRSRFQYRKRTPNLYPQPTARTTACIRPLVSVWAWPAHVTRPRAIASPDQRVRSFVQHPTR